MTLTLNTPVSDLHKIGTVLKKRLGYLGIETAEDLLFHFPFRYEDYRSVVAIKDLKEGEQVTVRAKIQLIANKRSPRKRTMITEAIVGDGTGQLRIVWFKQPFITKILKIGDEVHFSGMVKSDMFGLQLVSPQYEKLKTEPPTNPLLGKEGKASTPTHTGRIVPVYPLTAGITEKQIRFLISQVMPLAEKIGDWLPEEIRTHADVIAYADALRLIHFPNSEEELKQAEKRLKFDELFVLQLRAEMIRQSIKRSVAPKIVFQEQDTKDFVAALPFELTKDQKVAAWEILQDMEKSEPMNRLIEGDVGSGKTVVAALVMNNAVLNGYQAVMMAPTEILARQHFESVLGLLPEYKVVLLTGSEIGNKKLEIGGKTKKAVVQETKGKIANGEAQIIIGTHALLTENVRFKNLGLVVVDEQHRFGVEQRRILKEKSGGDFVPHFLSMTATPIPRSFALTLYGDLDLSIIKTKPAGRKDIITRLVEPKNREKAYAFIRGQVKGGRQVFVICPLISNEQDTSNKKQKNHNDQVSNFQKNDEKKTVMDEYKKLSEHIFPDLRVGYLHGKMKSQEKQQTMEQFNNGTMDILVSTSVIEVGVNVPNATVMMIEGAERFGLAQLHQFRGRVGRSDFQSYCFLFTDSDSQKALERLQYFEQTTDGFALAEYDLQTRGPGDVYGKAQSGMMQFRLATMKDVDIIKLSRDTARGIDFEKYPQLKGKVREWEERVHLE